MDPFSAIQTAFPPMNWISTQPFYYNDLFITDPGLNEIESPKMR